MKAKITGTLFALPFLSVGALACYFFVTDVSDAWRMRAWLPIMATLENAGYETNTGGDSDTYKAYARYHYEVNGVSYRHDRVAISRVSDNIGRFQQNIGRRLNDAVATGESIVIYVNPDDHADAIVERSLRWEMAGFQLIFLLIFGGVGAGIVYAVFRAPTEVTAAAAETSHQPWLTRPEWRDNRIRSSSRAAMWSAWAFAIIWSLISAPLPFLVHEEVTQKGNVLAWLGLIFPVVGAGLMVRAIRRSREWLRVGAAPLMLDPFPGAIGGHVGGQLDCRVPYDVGAEFQVTLSCIRSYMSGSGDGQSRKESVSWQDTRLAHASPGVHGTRLGFRFDVPEGLAESDSGARDSDYLLWRLNVSGAMPGTDLDRDYEIPVYATKARSAELPESAMASAGLGQKARDLAAVRRLIRFEHGVDGRSLCYPVGRHLAVAVPGVILGAIFTGAGWLLGTRGDAWFMCFMFAAVGLLILMASLYAMLNSLQVSQAGADIVTIRRLLGVPVRTARMPRALFSHFDMDRTMSSHSGSRHVLFFALKAVDQSGRAIVVGEGFVGASQANAAADLIAETFGLTPRAADPATRSDDDQFNMLAAD